MVTATRESTRVTRRFAHVWEGIGWHAILFNIFLRVFILIFTIDALINAGDQRSPPARRSGRGTSGPR